MVTYVTGRTLTVLGLRSRTDRHVARLVWVLAVVAAGMFITLSLGLAAFVILPVANVAEHELLELRQLSVGQLMTNDSSTLDDLYTQVSDLGSEVRPAASSMRWIGRFASAFSWLPFARPQVAAWAGQMERV